MLIIHKIMLA